MARLTAQITRKREILAWTLRIKGKREPAIALMIEEAGLGKVKKQAVSAMLVRVEARARRQMKEQFGGVMARQTEALWFNYCQPLPAGDPIDTPITALSNKLQPR